MDPSNNLEGTEGCSSNESGWTMYIGSSPDHEFDREEDDENFSSGEKGDKQTIKEDVDSDDSMASDASSGPSNLYGHVENKDERKCTGKKKCQKEDKKQHAEHMKAPKGEESGHKANNVRKKSTNIKK